MQPTALLRAGLVALSIVSAVPVAATSSGIVLAPGVVVDPQSSTAYLMAPGGRVVAVDAAQGKGLWTSEAASVPLHLVDGVLLAGGEGADTANSLDVLGLDPATGPFASRLSPTSTW